jgi:UDP-N-acetylglucosamine 2-epimerase (non-hydrolysing)/GDP/UDP-N,N'-diacetylbacillosamine 2-epimerase (hydrolysing)
MVHLEGGDITEGGVHDDSVRHAISKLATFHLPSNSASAKNLIQMGEEPWRVKNIGLSLSRYIADSNYSEEKTIREKYAIDHRITILFTIHALPLSADETAHLARESIRALTDLDEQEFNIIITHPNSDPMGDLIVKAYGSIRQSHIKIIPSLGRKDYHGLMALNLSQPGSVICVGNSSSGIKEAGFFKCVAVIRLGA